MLEYDHEGFRRDGRPHQIIAGAIHYFRIHPDQWDDRLARLRAMGLNTVDVYAAWNFHELVPGVADFTGWRDIARFVRLAARHGMDVILRPGPYICAEWDFGGLPARLLADEMNLRCSDPAFLDEVDAWFDALIPHLLPLLAGRGGPIVAMQVENEYGSFGNDAAYLRHLRDGLTDRGVDCLLLTSDGTTDAMLQAGSVPGALATANFGAHPESCFAGLRRYQPTGPLMCTEYWHGWFDHWGEPHHTRDPHEAAAVLDDILTMGASVNIYMAHGGTNFGFWAGANQIGSHPSSGYLPTVTSNDADAPVGEAGELTEKFHAFRAVIAKHAGVPDLPLPPEPSRQTPQRVARTGSAALLDMLDRLSTPVPSVVPLPMERLGQSHGLIHYRTRVTGPRGIMGLRIDGLGDRAHVLADGRLLGVLDRNDPDGELALDVAPGGAQIDIVVEALGRINYPTTRDHKGISGRVRHGALQHLYDWQIRPLPLDDLSALSFTEAPTIAGPAFHRFEPEVADPADAFLALPHWSSGLVWLNGFLLGRYDAAGPQRTLYAPAPLWTTGRNEIVVLEMRSPGDVLEICDAPILGPPAQAPRLSW